MTLPVAPDGKLTSMFATLPTRISFVEMFISGTDFLNWKLIVVLIPLNVPVREEFEGCVNVKSVEAIPFSTVIILSGEVPFTEVNAKSKLGNLTPS